MKGVGRSSAARQNSEVPLPATPACLLPESWSNRRYLPGPTFPPRRAAMSVPPYRHPIGVTRRELLQVGYSGLLGLGLSSLPAAAGPARRPKSVLLVFLTGAASQLETFDPKPEAPPEIRGEFGTIATALPGVRFSEHLPRLAARADKYAVVRTLSHRENNHLVATHHLLTGHQMPGAFFDK